MRTARLTSLLRTTAAATILAACTVSSNALANGETDPVGYWTIPFPTDSGEIRGVGAGRKPVHTEEVASAESPWVRVIFDPALTELKGPTRGEGATYIRVTSLKDGYYQILNADTLAEWGYSTAYFNGDAVTIEVFAAEGNSARLGVLEVQAGMVVDGSVASICGPTDDRIASTDPRVARLMPVGCTAWLFDGKPNAMLTAGHCFDGQVATVVQFNVPASLANGTPQNPPPQHQYAVDPASVQFANVAIGNDWGHFGVFSNSTTGLSPLIAQGGTSFARTAPAAGGVIRITGFGVDSNGPDNQTNQTHSGPFNSLVGTIIRYQADTTGGNSGSPVIRTSDGATMGIHTNAGCFDNGGSVGGANQGTTFGNAGLVNAINNPLGVAAATTACGLSAESCFTSHSTPHCNDASCCTTVCAIDPFCCNSSWDNICVTEAWDLCRNCGPGAGSCYATHGPGCEDISCCSTVCTADPFCCDTSWDSLCVQRAEATCRTGLTCAEAKLLTVSVPATLSFSTLEDSSGSDDSTCGTNDIYAVWRRYVPDCSGMSTITICSNDAVQPTVTVFSSCGGTQIACSASAAPCGANAGASVEFATLAGQSYYIRISAVNGLDTTGTIATMCEAVCGSGPSCTTVHSTPGCSDASCCVNVCSVDPFCCNVQWDSICVGGAQNLCFRDGDLNFDGVVNAADLTILLNGWGSGGVSDIDGSGTTNAADLSILLSNWG